MVEEAREFRDRAFLATLFLVGGTALASGILQIFWFGSYTPGPEFSAVLGGAILFVTAVYETPYRDPALVGLPGPGAHLETRAYLPYPVPVSDTLSAGIAASNAVDLAPPISKPEPVHSPRAPGRAPSSARATPANSPAALTAFVPPGSKTVGGASAPVAPRSPRMAQTSREVAYARNAIAALETLGNMPTTASYSPLPPLELKPYRADQPPVADYLEEGLPRVETPQVDANVQRSLSDLAGLAGQQTAGNQPIEFRNGKPPQETLTDIETALRATPPLEEKNGKGVRDEPHYGSMLPGTSEDGMQEMDHAEAELRGMPQVESLGGPTVRAPTEVPLAASPPALEAPARSPSTADPQTVGPSPPMARVAPATAAMSNLPDEATLESMAKALEGLISAGRGTTSPAVPPTPPEAAIPTTPSPSRPPPSSGIETPSSDEPVGTGAVPPGPSSSATIDDLSRQLEEMKSTLLAHQAAAGLGELPPPISGLPPPRVPRKSIVPTTPISEPPPTIPVPDPELNEEELQGVLDQANEAANEASSRHVSAKDTTPGPKRKKGNGNDRK